MYEVKFYKKQKDNRIKEYRIINTVTNSIVRKGLFTSIRTALEVGLLSGPDSDAWIMFMNGSGIYEIYPSERECRNRAYIMCELYNMD